MTMTDDRDSTCVWMGAAEKSAQHVVVKHVCEGSAVQNDKWTPKGRKKEKCKNAKKKNSGYLS